MAVKWIVCSECKGQRRWIVLGKMVLCRTCNGTGGHFEII